MALSKAMALSGGVLDAFKILIPTVTLIINLILTLTLTGIRGAVDALILTSPQRSIRMRIWLQLLNLGMGDWVHFTDEATAVPTSLGIEQE